jgi:hypothetical protein
MVHCGTLTSLPLRRLLPSLPNLLPLQTPLIFTSLEVSLKKRPHKNQIRFMHPKIGAKKDFLTNLNLILGYYIKKINIQSFKLK